MEPMVVSLATYDNSKPATLGYSTASEDKFYTSETALRRVFDRHLTGMGFAHRPLSSSFSGLPYGILNIIHKTELLRGPWVGFKSPYWLL